MFWEYTPMDGICQTTCKILTIIPFDGLSRLISLDIFLVRHIRDYKSIVSSFGNTGFWMEFTKWLTKLLQSLLVPVSYLISLDIFLVRHIRDYKGIIISFRIHNYGWNSPNYLQNSYYCSLCLAFSSAKAGYFLG